MEDIFDQKGEKFLNNAGFEIHAIYTLKWVCNQMQSYKEGEGVWLKSTWNLLLLNFLILSFLW